MNVHIAWYSANANGVPTRRQIALSRFASNYMSEANQGVGSANVQQALRTHARTHTRTHPRTHTHTHTHAHTHTHIHTHTHTHTHTHSSMCTLSFVDVDACTACNACRVRYSVRKCTLWCITSVVCRSGPHPGSPQNRHADCGAL